jgi:hypothetical protein
LLKAAEWPDYDAVVARVSAAMPPMMPGMLPPGMGEEGPPSPDKATAGAISPENTVNVRANLNGQEV